MFTLEDLAALCGQVVMFAVLSGYFYGLILLGRRWPTLVRRIPRWAMTVGLTVGLILIVVTTFAFLHWLSPDLVPEVPEEQEDD
jgi:hypothetical protein